MRGGAELQYDFIDNAIAAIILYSKLIWWAKYYTGGGFTDMNK